jgi:hypothetical protein
MIFCLLQQPRHLISSLSSKPALLKLTMKASAAISRLNAAAAAAAADSDGGGVWFSQAENEHLNACLTYGSVANE